MLTFGNGNTQVVPVYAADISFVENRMEGCCQLVLLQCNLLGMDILQKYQIYLSKLEEAVYVEDGNKSLTLLTDKLKNLEIDQ